VLAHEGRRRVFSGRCSTAVGFPILHLPLSFTHLRGSVSSPFDPEYMLTSRRRGGTQIVLRPCGDNIPDIRGIAAATEKVISVSQ
jgi:hypothetical protein